jgi:TolA-binding protein
MKKKSLIDFYFPFFFPRANSEIERLRRAHGSELEGIQTQLRYAQLRVQSLEQELKSVKQELEQKVKFIFFFENFIFIFF